MKKQKKEEKFGEATDKYLQEVVGRMKGNAAKHSKDVDKTLKRSELKWRD